jgi:hypothetical protein
MRFNLKIIIAAFLLVVAMQGAFAQYEIPTEGLVPPSEDLLVWVTGYSPATIRSDLLEDVDVPVFASLKGIQVNPFISIPVITRVSLRPAAAIKEKVTQNYLKPLNPTLDDLGRIVVTVKRIPTEAQMPDSIDVNVSAVIEYSYEDVLGFGQKDMVLDIVDEKTWNENDWKYEFWDKSGFLRLSDMDNQKASIILYESSKHEVSRFQLSAGEKSKPYFMNVHGKRGWVTIKLNSIDTPSPYAKVSVNIDGKKSSSILRANYPLFAGSEWKVTTVDAKIGGGGSITIRNSKGEQTTISIDTRTITINQGGELLNKGIGESVSGNLFVGWITSKEAYIINTSKLDEALKYIRDEIKSKGISESIFVNAQSRELISKYYIVHSQDIIEGTSIKLESITAPEYSVILDDPTARKYFDAALEQYNEIASGFEAEVRSDTKIESKYILYKESWPKSALWRAYDFTKEYHQAKSSEFLTALIQRYPESSEKSDWQKKLNAMTDFNYANAHTFLDDKGRSVSVMLESVEIPELTSSASLIVKGLQGDYKEGDMADEWYVEKITEKDVTFRRAVTDQREVINVGSEKELNKTSGMKIKVLSTKVQKEAYVTISPYHRDGQTTTNFTLHLPIEKRGIQLSPEQINDQIKNADEQIKQLDRITSDMGNTITGLKNTCFATYGILTIKKLITDWSGVQGKAQNIVMRGIDGNSGWIKICEDKIASEKREGFFYKSVQDCLSENADEILNQTDVAKKILEQTGNMSKYFFNKSGDVISYDKLKKQFVDEKLQDYIANQEYMKSKFGVTDLTRNDIEELFLYQGLSGQQGDSGIYIEAKNKFGSLQESYTKNNEIISTLKAPVPDSETTANYSSLKNPNDVKRRQNQLQLAKDHVAYKPVEKIDKLIANVIELEAGTDGTYKYKAYIPSLSATPVEVNKDGDKYSYMQGDKKLDVLIRQECAGKTKETTLRIYSSTKYKGKPALVPFGKGYTKIDEYDSNGMPKKMTIHVTSPLENGECPDIIYLAGEDLNAFEEADKKAIRSATQCVKDGLIAVKNKKIGDTFTCDNRPFSIGTDYAERAEQNYCEDFFSRSDCNILYQVCDPVICPPSRCDFGGRFKVPDVVQSGIFGSILLCAPNFPTPVIAVCLPGIRAGLLGYQSMLKGYKSCLQKQIETGETVGICDRIRSLYWCDLLWKTVLSMYDEFGGFYGIISGAFDKTKGGGEYITAYSGLQEAEKSLNYFASVYAEDTFARFRNLKTEEIGGYVCRRAIYGSVPTSMDIFADISKVNAPPQFFGHVEESAYAVITTPQSHYKVYYHIYAGEEKGIYYKVYLSSPISSPFYATPLQEYPLDAGYLAKGAFLDKAPDFIAPSGYSQLCIEIDGGVPYCGFGWVSSEMLVQEITDSYSKKLASSNIRNEDECIFSSPAVIPVVGRGLEGTQLLQRRGINRICTSGDPNAGKGERTWDAVGWCNQQAGIKCWLDRSSAQEAIKDLKIEQETLADAKEKVSDLLKEVYATSNDTKAKLNQSYLLYQKGDYDKAIALSEQILVQTVETSLIDEARFIIGLSYERLFENKKAVLDKQTLTTAKAEVKKPEITPTPTITPTKVIPITTASNEEISKAADNFEKASGNIFEIKALIVHYPHGNESLIEIIKNFYLKDATPELEKRIMDLNGLSFAKVDTEKYSVIVPQGTVKVPDITSVLDIIIDSSKNKFIILPMYSGEQKAFEDKYLGMPNCDKAVLCQNLKFEITKSEDYQGRKIYATKSDMCYQSSETKCASCSKLAGCSEIPVIKIAGVEAANYCENLKCTSLSSQNLECSLVEFAGTKQCISKGITKEYNDRLSAFDSMKPRSPKNAAIELSKFVSKNPTSFYAFYAAREIYNLAQENFNIGAGYLGIEILNTITSINVDSKSNDYLYKTIDSSRKIANAYAAANESFDNLLSRISACKNSQNINCKCSAFDYAKLKSSMMPVYGYDPNSLEKGILLQNPDKELGWYKIVIDVENMRLIDLTHGNKVVKSKSVTWPICYFKSKFENSGLMNYGYDRFSEYIASISELNPDKIDIYYNVVSSFSGPGNIIETQGGLYLYFIKNMDLTSPELFKYNTQVCFVRTDDADYKQTITRSC